MDRLTPITSGELLDEEFLQPLGVSQYRLAKAMNVPASRISEVVAGQEGGVVGGEILQRSPQSKWRSIPATNNIPILSKCWCSIRRSW